MRNEKLAAILLLAIAFVAMIFTIVDFQWKCQGLTCCFLLVYLGTGTTGFCMWMESTGNAPSYIYQDDEQLNSIDDE